MLMAEMACVFLLFFLVQCPHWNVTHENLGLVWLTYSVASVHGTVPGT